LGSLIPQHIDGLIVSDKAISVSNVINGSTRLQPCVLLTGQAAGALAALSVLDDLNVRNINIRKIQQTLLDAGAYLMPLFDVNPTEKNFKTIQRVTASGILKVKGESYHWANRTWFYPTATITVKEFSEGLNAFDKKFTVSTDQAILNLQKASDMISTLQNKDCSKEILKIWENKMDRKFDSKLEVNKCELSILIDELIRPFETKSIGFDGNYR